MRRVLYLFLGLLLLQGCASLSLGVREVTFVDPLRELNIELVEATEEEQEGILLRLYAPADKIFHAQEQTRIFSKIERGKGELIQMTQDRLESFAFGENADSYRVKNLIQLKPHGGEIREDYEMTTRGAIIRFYEGYHESKAGKFDMIDWERSPLYPAEKVRVHDVWEYHESLNLSLQSFWIKQLNPTPYRLLAKSNFTGFATVEGKRCAVIESTAQKTRVEELKVFLKKMVLSIHIKIQEISYLDYKQGRLVARITRTQSEIVDSKGRYLDRGQSQSLYRVLS